MQPLLKWFTFLFFSVVTKAVASETEAKTEAEGSETKAKTEAEGSETEAEAQGSWLIF